MQLIAAVDNNWAIGFQNSLLVRIPRDQQMFREMTEGKVIVVGRKTFEVVHSMDELLEALKNYDSRDVFVAGGAGVYEQLLPYCDTAHITKIDYTYQADAYCPRLDTMADWHCTAESEEQTYFDIEYYFQKYERKK